MNKLSVIGVGTVIAAMMTGCMTSRGPAYDNLIAHRGESYDAPENTLPAYRMAVDRGFGFECDIYMSNDGRLFTFHDGDLKRTTGGASTNRCVDASWTDELSKVNVGGWGKWKGSRFDPTRPALFEEVLALARPGRKIYVEVKGGDAAVNWVEGIRKLVDAEARATPETVLFICFSAKTCAELKRRMPEFKVYWLTSRLDADAVLAKLESCGADGVDIRYDSEKHTEEYIGRIRSAGYEFHVWTVDDPAKAAEALSRGAQTVTTNRAKYILDTLSR